MQGCFNETVRSMYYSTKGFFQIRSLAPVAVRRLKAIALPMFNDKQCDYPRWRKGYGALYKQGKATGAKRGTENSNASQRCQENDQSNSNNSANESSENVFCNQAPSKKKKGKWHQPKLLWQPDCVLEITTVYKWTSRKSGGREEEDEEEGKD